MNKDLEEKHLSIVKVEGNDSSSIGRVIKQLEHQYEKIMQKHNEGLAFNRQLKEEINTLRRERVIYDNIYTQLEVETKKKASELLEVITQTEEVVKTRKTSEIMLKELKKRADREEEEFRQEYNRTVNGLELATNPLPQEKYNDKPSSNVLIEKNTRPEGQKPENPRAMKVT